MLDFLKRKKPQNEEHTTKSEEGLLGLFKSALKRSSSALSSSIESLFNQKKLDLALLEELEDFLLVCDFGVQTTETLLNVLRSECKKNPDLNLDEVKQILKERLEAILVPCQKPFMFPTAQPSMILVVGVNGVGKTTTIGKLARHFKLQGKEVLLAAGDTFRAAAIEQLQSWGNQNEVSVIAQQSGADSASVIFDALQSAISRKTDLLIADTAGRLHTQDGLMEELKKIVRVVRKLDENAPHEILLVLDASVGQNALLQAKKFHEALALTGIILTKLDGTAKGGVVFNLVETLKLPIRFIGIGEGISDLKVFDPKLFIEALFS